MSREEVSAFLRNLQLSLDGLQREVEGMIRRVPETKREQLPDLLAGCRATLAKFHGEQLAEFESFAAETGLQITGAPVSASTPGADTDMAVASPGISHGGHGGGGGEATPYAVNLRSLEKRVASMGGIPALGACVLPRMTPGMRPQLNATASPAAVEIMQRRIGGDDTTPLKRSSTDGEAAVPTPLVQLKQTPKLPPVKGMGAAGTSPAGSAPPESELAAAIQRRMQRLASASPEKDASAAAAATSSVAC